MVAPSLGAARTVLIRRYMRAWCSSGESEPHLSTEVPCDLSWLYLQDCNLSSLSPSPTNTFFGDGIPSGLLVYSAHDALKLESMSFPKVGWGNPAMAARPTPNLKAWNREKTGVAPISHMAQGELQLQTWVENRGAAQAQHYGLWILVAVTGFVWFRASTAGVL